MKYQINRLRDMIKILYPYQVYRNLKRIFCFLSVFLFIMMIVFCLVEPKAVPFEEAGDSDYAYLEIDFISKDHYQGYYIVEKDGYCFIYHNEEGFDQELIDLQNGKSRSVKVLGVSDRQVDEEILKGLIPIFNDLYADQVHSGNEVAYFTGYRYLDHDMTFNAYQIGISFVFTVVFFLMLWGIKGAEKFYTKVYQPYFEDICYRGEDVSALEELQHPLHAFYHLKAVVLPNYLVCNHQYLL